jgi:hypothetical protein
MKIVLRSYSVLINKGSIYTIKTGWPVTRKDDADAGYQGPRLGNLYQ